MTCQYNSTGSVRCGCGVSTHRYDTSLSSCVSICSSGSKWIPESDIYVSQSYFSPSGTCEMCESGTFSVIDVNMWSETCEPCSVGM